MARDSLTRVTSEDDTHPGPLDRFRYVERITSQTEAQISGEVWDLFKDRAGLTTEMTSMVQQDLHSLARDVDEHFGAGFKLEFFSAFHRH